MQAKLPDGYVMVSGGCSKDAELQLVGEKQSRKCSVGIAVGKREDETIWANVVAWHDLASALCVARKGDSVFVIGRVQSREYNGKTYNDLVAEHVNVCSVLAAANNPTAPQAKTEDAAGEEWETAESELPF